MGQQRESYNDFKSTVIKTPKITRPSYRGWDWKEWERECSWSGAIQTPGAWSVCPGAWSVCPGILVLSISKRSCRSLSPTPLKILGDYQQGWKYPGEGEAKAAWPSVCAQSELTHWGGGRSTDSSGSLTPKCCVLRFLPEDKYPRNLQASGTNAWWLLWAIVSQKSSVSKAQF